MEQNIRATGVVRSNGQASPEPARVERDGDVHARAQQDWAPLHFASGRGDSAAVTRMLRSGADPTAFGSDRRRPAEVAAAAGHDAVASLLRSREPDAGPLRPYCRAVPLGALRRFPEWREELRAPTINEYWPTDLKEYFEKAMDDDDIVFLHQDLTVTRSVWPSEGIIFDRVTPAWRDFCREQLGFSDERASVP